MSQFTQPLRLEYVGNGLWRVTRSFDYHVGEEGSPTIIPIFENFLTDLASMPWIARVFIKKDADHNQPSVLHDLVYCINAIRAFIQEYYGPMGYEDYLVFGVTRVYFRDYFLMTRKECDDVFLESMEVVDKSPYHKIPKHRRWLMYQAVRRFGRWSKKPKRLFRYVNSYSIKALDGVNLNNHGKTKKKKKNPPDNGLHSTTDSADS